MMYNQETKNVTPYPVAKQEPSVQLATRQSCGNIPLYKWNSGKFDIVGEYKPTTLPSGDTDSHCMTTTDWTWTIDLENTYFTESEDG